jgi:hypothetical protein
VVAALTGKQVSADEVRQALAKTRAASRAG